MGNDKKNYDIIEETFQSSFEEKAHIYVKHYIPKNGIDVHKKYIHFYFQHGMIEYHRRHEEFFEYLLDHYKGKIIISVMDLLGHGLSGGHRAYVDEFKTFLLDMVQFFYLCDSRFPNDIIKKRILGSHSLGGLISLKTVVSGSYNLPFQFEKLIFVNPCICPKIELPKMTLNMLRGIPPLMRRVRVPLIYNAYDLSQDSEKAKEFMHDHLISKSVTIKLALETVKATEGINTLSYFCKIPCLFILSGDDVVVDNDKSELFITGMDKSLVVKKNYPNMKHDILNETCRIDVFKEIIGYINS